MKNSSRKNYGFSVLPFTSAFIKKVTLTVLVSFFALSVSYAQVFMIGPKVGISSSRISIDDNIQNVKEGDARFGFHAGLFTRITLPAFYIQPEVLFTNNGGKIEFNDGAGEQITEYEFNKLDVPVMVGFKLANVLRLQAGPVASILLNAEGDGLVDEVQNNYKDATFGYQAGIGIDVGSLILDLKYEGNLSKFGENVEIAGTSARTDLRNNQWILSLGLKL